jgi:RimJ/RimL family protein N-acetyltransferase
MIDLLFSRPVPVGDTSELRLLQSGDLSRLESLTQRCDEVEAAWTLRTLSRSLTRWPTAEDRAILGIFETGTDTGPARRLQGIAAIAPDLGQPGSADVAILVDPEWRGRGFGRRLTKAIMQVASAQGYRSVIARVGPGNVPFLRIARRLGLAQQQSVGAEPLLLWGPATDGQSRRDTRVRMS